MNPTYNIELSSGRTISLTEEDVSQLDFIRVSKNQYHLIHNHKSINIELIQSNLNKRTYSLKIDGKVYEAKIHNELDQLIDKMGFELGSEKDVNYIVAPMPGLILNIEVKEGQKVKENDPILILEAMKMENVLVAPRNAVIKAVKACTGKTVDKNDLLVELE